MVGKQAPLSTATLDRVTVDLVRIERKDDPVPPPVLRRSATHRRTEAAQKTPPVTRARLTRSVLVETWVLPGEHRDQAEDDAMVADLTGILIEQASDEWRASELADDPDSRCSELLAVELTGYDQVIADGVEAEAFHSMLDAAQDLADRLRDEADDDDGW